MDDMEYMAELLERSQRKIVTRNGAGYKLTDAPVVSGRHVLGKILILPRDYAEQFVYDKPWACISIS
jgi:hypothetical protein